MTFLGAFVPEAHGQPAIGHTLCVTRIQIMAQYQETEVTNILKDKVSDAGATQYH